MLLRKLIASLCLLAFLPQTVFADVIATTKGEQLAGVIADREQFAKNSRTTPVVSLLVTNEATGETEILRIAAADIEYVVLEDADQRRVFDLQTPGPAPTSMPVPGRRNPNRLGSDPRASDTTKEGGVVLTLLGAGALAVGLLVKLGGPKATVTSSSIDVDEKSYDSANYALMAVGGLALLGGLLMLSTYDARQRQQAPSASALETRVGVCFAF